MQAEIEQTISTLEAYAKHLSEPSRHERSDTQYPLL
jgi:hypothetical protein